MSAAEFESASKSAKGDPSAPRDEFVSLIDVFAVIWSGKWLILSTGVLIAVAATLVSRYLEKQYESSIVVSVVSEDSNSSSLGVLGALASQFSGLASLASTSGNRKAEYMAILQSESLTTAFIEKNNLLPVLYAQKWDAAENRWKKPKDVPTLWMANRLFKKSIRTISVDLKTGLLTLTITWNDPMVSAQWANGVVAMANEYIRAKAISDGERNVAYLNEQLANSNVVAVQNSISSLLENEIKKIMLARGSGEYAFRIIDAATVPERPSSPNPILWGIVGSIAGVLLSTLLVLALSQRVRRLLQ